MDRPVHNQGFSARVAQYLQQYLYGWAGAEGDPPVTGLLAQQFGVQSYV